MNKEKLYDVQVGTDGQKKIYRTRALSAMDALSSTLMTLRVSAAETPIRSLVVRPLNGPH